MELPLAVKQILDRYLELVRNSSNHILTGIERLKIYESFGFSIILGSEKIEPRHVNDRVQYLKNQFSNFTIADYTLSWLAVLTAEYSLHIWKESSVKSSLKKGQSITPPRILNSAKGVLQNTVTFESAYNDLCEDFNLALNICDYVTYNVYCVYEAAFLALELIITQNALRLNNKIASTNDEVAWFNDDFVSASLKAYTTSDPNIPGDWTDGVDSGLPIKFDPQKCLEFWEWWLTEAIPQAWELAQQTNTSH